jgi:hypothetical protein
MPDQFIFLQFAVRYSFLHSMDLPELQIDDILRYLGEDDDQESAPSLQYLMYRIPHLSHRLHRPVLLHSIRGWQPPLKDSIAKLYYNHHTYTKRATLDGVTLGEFNHNIAGAAKQLS